MSDENIDEKTQHLQSMVDATKTASILNAWGDKGALIPPQQQREDGTREIAIIEGLKTNDLMLYRLYLEARGMEEISPGKYEQRNHAYMNARGALKFVQIVGHIVQPTEFSNFHEDEIPARLVHSFERDITEFKINQELYELETSDFNWIDSIYQSAIDAAYHKAKGGKYVNVVGKTYDERGIANLLNPQQKKEVKGFADKFSGLNPFK